MISAILEILHLKTKSQLISNEPMARDLHFIISLAVTLLLIRHRPRTFAVFFGILFFFCVFLMIIYAVFYPNP